MLLNNWISYSIFLLLTIYLISTLLVGLLFHNQVGEFPTSIYWKIAIHAISKHGPVAVKVAQWISNRPDIVSEECAGKLAVLREHCPTHPFQHSKTVIERNMGKRMDELFHTIDNIPIASGSIGQVYRGKLRRGGAEVAVKVRHPDVKQQIDWTFQLTWALDVLSEYLPGLVGKMPISLEQFHEHLIQQADYRVEAYNLRKMKFIFRKESPIIIPNVYYASEEVLIMSWEEGVRFSNISHKKQQLQAAKLLELSVAKMLLIDNFIHADLHLGNWAVRLDSAEGSDNDAKVIGLIFYDLGLITSTEDIQINRKFWEYLRQDQWEEMITLCASQLPPQTTGFGTASSTSPAVLQQVLLSAFQREILKEKKKLNLTTGELAPNFNDKIESPANLSSGHHISALLTAIRDSKAKLNASVISILVTTQLIYQQLGLVPEKTLNGKNNFRKYLTDQIAYAHQHQQFQELVNYWEKVYYQVPVIEKELFPEAREISQQWSINEDDLSDIE